MKGLMKKVLCGFVLAMVVSLIGGVLPTEATAQDVPPAAPAAPIAPDAVTLKNGSIIYGEVIEMAYCRSRHLPAPTI